MAMLRVFGITVAAGLMVGTASANQDTSATYVVSYVEVAPSSAPTRQPCYSRARPAFWGFMAMIGTELYGETTIPKPGKIEAPHGPGVGLDLNPAVRK